MSDITLAGTEMAILSVPDEKKALPSTHIEIASGNPYSEEKYRKQMEEWRLILHNLDDGKIKTNDAPIHAYLKYWVGYGTMPGQNNKEELKKAIEEDPKTAQEIQDLAQWILKNQNLQTVILYRGIIDGQIISPWDSLTSNRDFAETSANPYLDLGWKTGDLVELEVPVENIFTFYKAHPAFNPHLPEEEYILNGGDFTGVKLISINGNNPTTEQISKILPPQTNQPTS